MNPSSASGKASDLSAAPDKQALKRETRALIKAAGGLEAAASYCRPGKTALGDYQNWNVDSFMPIDVVADLEAVTRGSAGWPTITRRLATMAGGAFVELPEPNASRGDWMAEIGEIVSHHSRLAASLCDAAAGDNEVTDREVAEKQLLRLCDDAILDLVNLRARFERIVEEGRG